MSEAEYLESQCDGGADEWCKEQDELAYYNSLSDMQKRYEDNKRAHIGTTIRCACCRKRILKKSYQTQFCSNKGKGNCKDTYWNNTNDTRRDRSHRFSK